MLAPKSSSHVKLFDTLSIVAGRFLAKCTVSLMTVGITMMRKADRKPTTRK